LHAEEEMKEDDLSIFDVERMILTGDIIERQRDQETGEWKYLVRGHVMDGLESMVMQTRCNGKDGNHYGISRRIV
jgi:Domain of unknown function (DUF4258)